jgi:flagellar biosynthesis/type III secretory pathway protein FliH
MKSSNSGRLIHAETAGQRDLLTWAPLDLTRPEDVTSPVEVQAIRRLFEPAENTVILAGNGHSAVIKTGAPFRPEMWTLPEIEEIDADELESWNFPTVNSATYFSQPQESQPDGEFSSDDAQVTLSSARLQAEEIILQAGRTADQIVLEAQEEAQRTLEETRQAARDEVHQAAQPMLQALEQMVTQVDAWQNALFRQAEGVVTQMVTDIARMMFGEGLVLDDKALQANLSRVLESAHALGDLKVFLNPQDAAVLDSAWRETQSVIIGSRVQVVSSEGITRGGCYVQGAHGALDARVETQLNTILDTLTDAGGEL